MPKLSPKAGDTFTVGTDGIVGALPPGLEVTVDDIVDAGEDGVGGKAGDGNVIVIAWPEPALVAGENGPEVGEVTRRMSIPAAEFGDLFTKPGGR